MSKKNQAIGWLIILTEVRLFCQMCMLKLGNDVNIANNVVACYNHIPFLRISVLFNIIEKIFQKDLKKIHFHVSIQQIYFFCSYSQKLITVSNINNITQKIQTLLSPTSAFRFRNICLFKISL